MSDIGASERLADAPSPDDPTQQRKPKTRRGGLGGSAPNVARWLGDIRSFFPASVVRVMQQDAMDRLNLRQMLMEPEMLQAVDPDVHLAADLLALKSVMPAKTRETARVTHPGVASFAYKGKDIECPIHDISRSGILLSTDLNIEPGTKLSLSFELPGYLKPIKVEGEVIRRISGDSRRDVPAGLGIRFDEFSGDSQKRLEKYVAKTQVDDPKLVYYL